MPSYIELDKLGSLPPASSEGKVVLGIDQSGNLSITDNNGQTSPVTSAGTNKLTVDFNSVGPKVSFVKTNYGSEVDVIIPDVLEITRGNNQGIYNAAIDSEWNSPGPTNTEWNSKYINNTNYGWTNLLTAGDRTFDDWISSLGGGGNVGQNIIGLEMIVRETTTNRMWLIKFTQWTPNAQGGGFAYDRYELVPTVEFTRPDDEQNTVDEITPGRLVLKRDSYPDGDCVGGGLYNSALESFYNSCVRGGPAGTEWNSEYIDNTTYGFDNLSDVRTRKYDTWDKALGGGNVGNNIIGLEMIMHDLTSDAYYKFQFSDWTSGGNGGGFAYTRTLIPLQQAITFSDGTVQETAAPGYKSYTALLTQNSTTVSSGTLTIDELYTITNYVAGDDFTNVANIQSGSINSDGCVFIATGDTPTAWTNGTELTINLQSEPIATVLNNTLGFTPQWVYENEGVYSFTSSGAFPIDKTFVITPVTTNGPLGAPQFKIVDTSGFPDIFRIYSPVGNDSIYNYTPIEIRVYN